MGMDSKKLSARMKQPGDDQTYVTSELAFVEMAKKCLDPKKYSVEPKPKDLVRIFAKCDHDCDLGIIPEAVIRSLETKRMFFVEVKKQGDAGNAEERAMKHHTVQFYKTLREHLKYDYHPYVTVFCDSLATSTRYTDKFKYLIEPNQYFLWKKYDLALLKEFLDGRCRAWLDPK